MPINSDWLDMCRSMSKSYKKGPTKCRDFSNGKKLCMTEEAWNMFFATGTKRYGAGFEMKAHPMGMQETLVDEIVAWYLRDSK
jgi:hypothetical protein